MSKRGPRASQGSVFCSEPHARTVPSHLAFIKRNRSVQAASADSTSNGVRAHSSEATSREKIKAWAGHKTTAAHEKGWSARTLAAAGGRAQQRRPAARGPAGRGTPAGGACQEQKRQATHGMVVDRSRLRSLGP